MPTKDNHWLLRIRRGRPRRGLARRRATCCTDHRWGSEREGRILADSNFWTPSQLVILGSILMLAGLLAVRPSIAGDGFTDALTRLGIYAATIGATVGMIKVILNGVAAKQLADHKQLAAAASRA